MTEPSTQPVAALSAFARVRAWLAARGKALAAWWSGSVHWHLLATLLITAVMFGSIAYLATRALNRCGLVDIDAEQPAAVQTNPLAPLVDRLNALDDQVAELKDQVDGLQRLQPQAAPRRSAAQRTAPAPSTQPSTAPERRRWGTTDLDREIDAFTQSLDTPTPLEPTK